MLTSGVILDQYDDPNQVVLLQYFPSQERIPDMLKCAGAAPDPARLPDEAFALIIKDGDLVLLMGFGAGLSWGSCLMRWSTGAGRPGE